jgi:acyl-CoA thioester hydrolase
MSGPDETPPEETLPDDLPAEARGLSGRLEDGVHRLWLRIYYEDTDAAGIVYYANYLRYAERARTEMLRLVGVGQRRLMEEKGLAFAVAGAELDYKSPARLDDVIEVRSHCTRFTRVQLTIDQQMVHALERREIARARVRVACLDANTRPARIPDAVARALEPYTPSLQFPE